MSNRKLSRGFRAIAVLLLGLALLSPLRAAATVMIEELEFKEARLIDAIRIISELSGDNIVATPAASDTQVTLYLRNISVRDAIETICRVNNLWYRLDRNTGTYRIMTGAEYGDDLVIHRDDKTRVFTLRNPNVELVADAIANLYGSRVIKTTSGSEVDSDAEGDDDGDDGDGGGSSSSSGTGGGSGDPSFVVQDQLSIDQLSSLRTRGDSLNQISAAQLQQLSSQKETIFVTRVPEHNLLVVRSGDQQAMDDIAALVKELDRPVPQVLLEMKILDVLVGDDFKSVFNFAISGSRLSGDSAQPILLGNNPLTGGSLVFEFINDRLQANVELLQRENKVRVLSTPMILASNNRASKLFVGEEQVLVTGFEVTNSVVSDNGQVIGGSIVPQTETREVGNSIEITPFINDDGTIALRLEQENSSIRKGGGEIQVVPVNSTQPTTLTIDTVNTANLEGTVIAQDGRTVAVGGLIRTSLNDEQQKVPLLGDLPAIGKLFTSTIEAEEKSELVLLITPHVIRNAAQGEAISKDRLDNLGSREGRDLLALEDGKTPASKPTLEQSDPEMIRRAIALTREAARNLARGVTNRPLAANYQPQAARFKQWQLQRQLSADSLGGFKAGDWYVTTLRLNYHGEGSLPLTPELFDPRWLSLSFDRNEMAAGEAGHVFIVSQAPLLSSLQQTAGVYLLTEDALKENL